MKSEEEDIIENSKDLWEELLTEHDQELEDFTDYTPKLREGCPSQESEKNFIDEGKVIKSILKTIENIKEGYIEDDHEVLDDIASKIILGIHKLEGETPW